MGFICTGCLQNRLPTGYVLNSSHIYFTNKSYKFRKIHCSNSLAAYEPCRLSQAKASDIKPQAVSVINAIDIQVHIIHDQINSNEFIGLKNLQYNPATMFNPRSYCFMRLGVYVLTYCVLMYLICTLTLKQKLSNIIQSYTYLSKVIVPFYTKTKVK